MRPTFVRRLRALLFQIRAVLVFVALAIGIVCWMLAGIVAAAVATLLRHWSPRPMGVESMAVESVESVEAVES